MVYCFLTLEPLVCRRIISCLSQRDKDLKCFIQHDLMRFHSSIASSDCEIDLILCDFKLNKASFNLYEIMRENGVFIPVVFYNDPNPDRDSRVRYWLLQNEIAFSRHDLEHLVPEFSRINDVLERPDVLPYISLLQPPLALGRQRDRECKSGRMVIDIVQYRKRNCMTPVLFRLFRHMYNNQGREISVRELSRIISRGKDLFGRKKSSVYSYISRLKKCIGNDDSVNIEINRTSPGFYEMILH